MMGIGIWEVVVILATFALSVLPLALMLAIFFRLSRVEKKIDAVLAGQTTSRHEVPR